MSCVQVKSSLKGSRPGTAGLDAMSPATQQGGGAIVDYKKWRVVIVLTCGLCAGEELPERRQAGNSGSGRHEPCSPAARQQQAR